MSWKVWLLGFALLASVGLWWLPEQAPAVSPRTNVQPVEESAVPPIQMLRWSRQGNWPVLGTLTLWADGRSQIEVPWPNSDHRLALARPRPGWRYLNGLFSRTNPYPAEKVQQLLEQLQSAGVTSLENSPRVEAAEGIYCLFLEQGDRSQVICLPREMKAADPPTMVRYQLLKRLLTFDSEASVIDPSRCTVTNLLEAIRSRDPFLRRSGAYLLAQFDQPESLQALEQAAWDWDSDVATLARNSLQQLRPNQSSLAASAEPAKP